DLALVLFAPWFLILSVLFWVYPRQPRNAKRRLFDIAALLLSLLAFVATLRWAHGYADPRHGRMWPQILATSAGYGVYPLARPLLRVVHLHHAEPLPARRLHHPPALHERHLPGAQLLQPVGLGVDVVGLDVQVHARGMRHLLHLDVQVAGRVAELLVLGGPVAGVRVLDDHAERAAPEPGRGVEVVDVAVDDESCKATLVGHGGIPGRGASAAPTWGRRGRRAVP